MAENSSTEAPKYHLYNGFPAEKDIDIMGPKFTFASSPEEMTSLWWSENTQRCPAP